MDETVIDSSLVDAGVSDSPFQTNTPKGDAANANLLDSFSGTNLTWNEICSASEPIKDMWVDEETEIVFFATSTNIYAYDNKNDKCSTLTVPNFTFEKDSATGKPLAEIVSIHGEPGVLHIATSSSGVAQPGKTSEPLLYKCNDPSTLISGNGECDVGDRIVFDARDEVTDILVIDSNIVAVGRSFSKENPDDFDDRIWFRGSESPHPVVVDLNDGFSGNEFLAISGSKKGSILSTVSVGKNGLYAECHFDLFNPVDAKPCEDKSVENSGSGTKQVFDFLSVWAGSTDSHFLLAQTGISLFQSSSPNLWASETTGAIFQSMWFDQNLDSGLLFVGGQDSQKGYAIVWTCTLDDFKKSYDCLDVGSGKNLPVYGNLNAVWIGTLGKKTIALAGGFNNETQSGSLLRAEVTD